MGLESTNNSTLAGKYLTFTISAERYGLDILKVQEIIKVTHITKVPKSPAFIKGVINLRGKIIPVIDLRVKFGIESIPYDERTCIIVINMTLGDQRISIGAIVDTVLEVINFSNKEIELAPDYGEHIESNFILGMGKKDNNLNILIDIDKIVGDRETNSIVASV